MGSPSPATADLCESNVASLANGDLRVLESAYQAYGQKRSFAGPVVTVKVFEDNNLVRNLIATKGEGRVLVVDGQGSRRCAVVGGKLAQRAHDNGWAGIVVNGCIRDVDEINGCPIGVRALGSNPVKPKKTGAGESNCPVYVASHWIREGEWLYADSDGIVVSRSKLSG